MNENQNTLTEIPAVPEAKPVQRDMLTTTVTTWNSSNPIAEIKLRDPATSVLARWDVKPIATFYPHQEKKANGKVQTSFRKTGMSVLACTDGQGMVGVPYNPKSYRVFTNQNFIETIELILQALDKVGVKYQIATTGSVEDRNRVFVSIKIVENEKFTVGEREFLAFIDVLNSFDKSTNIIFNNSTICICCANTFKMALEDDSGAFKICIPHRPNSKVVLENVPKLIEMAFTQNTNFASQLKGWYEFEVGLKDAENFFAYFLGQGVDPTGNEYISTKAVNTTDRLVSLFANGKGNLGKNALDLFSAATEYYTHESAGETKDPTKQFESSEFGSGAKRKGEFFAALSQACKSAENFKACARIGETLLVAYSKKPAKIKP